MFARLRWLVVVEKVHLLLHSLQPGGQLLPGLLIPLVLFVLHRLPAVTAVFAAVAAAVVTAVVAAVTAAYVAAVVTAVVAAVVAAVAAAVVALLHGLVLGI